MRTGDGSGADALPGCFERLYPGEAGGKAAGLIRIARALEGGAPLAGENTARLCIPPSAVIGTDLFEEVVEMNSLADLVRRAPEEGREREPYDAFLGARLPERARERFRAWLEGTTVPLAVRSSSVQEDNPHYSFSGVYRTHFVTNTGDLEGRVAAFEHAVRVVLGSTFLPRARTYRVRHGIRHEDERMAVLVQPVVGRRRGDLFYPLLSGVGFSKNMYPWSDRLSVDDGVVRLVYGLGTRAVGREYARVFVPAFPQLRPEGHSVEAIEQYSQERFDALDLAAGEFRPGIPIRSVVGLPDADVHLVASLVREGEFLQTPRFPLERDDRFVITFEEVLAGRSPLPLVPMIRALFSSLGAEIGSAVDLEFACPRSDEGGEGMPEELWIVQVRPLGVREANRRVTVDPGGHRVVLRARKVMGNGEVFGVRHVILVLADEYRRARPSAVVREIHRLNRGLGGRPFLLVGPGRWGTTNPTVGVPITYEALAGCSAIVEVASGTMAPEVSYGTHFFGELLTSEVLYLAVVPREGDLLDEEFLLGHSSEPRDGVRFVELPEPLTLQVDGRTRQGVAFVAPGAGASRGPGAPPA